MILFVGILEYTFIKRICSAEGFLSPVCEPQADKSEWGTRHLADATQNGFWQRNVARIEVYNTGWWSSASATKAKAAGGLSTVRDFVLRDVRSNGSLSENVICRAEFA